jgi:hypothetical protein
VRYGLFFFLFLLFSACLNEPDCLINTTNLVKIDFKNAAGAEQTVTVSKITVSGLTENLYINQTVKAVQLPLNPQDTETTFTFQIGTTTSTLTVTYAKTTRIVSTACGAYVYYSDLAVADHNFTTVKVKNKLLYTNITSNVEISF